MTELSNPALDAEALALNEDAAKPKRRVRPRLARKLADAEDREIDTPHGPVMAWRLGEGPASLLVHGWENGVYSLDHHLDIKNLLPSRVREVDQPVAALLKDLKQRGMWDDTLVVWTSEMGRTPFGEAGGGRLGRNHNQWWLLNWFAGGGGKAGADAGATDEFGLKAAADPIPIRNVHATILQLLGLDHKRLTYRYQGRDFRLTDVAGNVVTQILA